MSINKPKDEIRLDRQPSMASTMTRVSSWADLSSSISTLSTGADSIASLASLQNLAISMLVFGVGFYCKEYFAPPHDEAYDRHHPYQVTAMGDVVLDFQLSKPLVRPGSVPSKLLHRTCVYAPLVLLAFIHCRSRWNCFLASISGHLTAMGLCELSTHILKYYVLRRRPNFYAFCGWNGESCTAPPRWVLEAQLSFPSGHSSLSWCGMTFLVLVMLGKLLPWASRGQALVWRQWLIWVVCLVPWSWSMYVAASRIVDYWHHPSDVVAGSLIGIGCATISYHSVFPHILSHNAGVSHIEIAERKNR